MVSVECLVGIFTYTSTMHNITRQFHCCIRCNVVVVSICSSSNKSLGRSFRFLWRSGWTGCTLFICIVVLQQW